MNVAPKNEKMDLGILQHLEKLLGSELGWVISAYPPTMNIAPKNEKLDLGILQHLEHFQHAPNLACHTLGLGLGLSTCRHSVFTTNL